MSFSIGLLELLVIACVAVPAVVLYARRDARYRWLAAGWVCAVLAALLSPADIASMGILWLGFVGTFALGVRSGGRRLTPAS